VCCIENYPPLVTVTPPPGCEVPLFTSKRNRLKNGRFVFAAAGAQAKSGIDETQQ
jgi:hypothetical protein